VVAAGMEMHRRLGDDVNRLMGLRLIIPDTPGLRRQKNDLSRIKPTSREAADHSFNFLAAISLIDGEFGLQQFEGERWFDPHVCALMAQLEIVNDAAWNTRAPDSFPCALEARTADGREHLVEVLYPPGFSRGLLDAEVVTAKFDKLAAPRLARAARERIVEEVMTLDRKPTCAPLMAALAT
jgi:2-methylcitrate dehydratase